MKLAGGCAHAVLQTPCGPGAGIGAEEENQAVCSRRKLRSTYFDLIDGDTVKHKHDQNDLIDAGVACSAFLVWPCVSHHHRPHGPAPAYHEVAALTARAGGQEASSTTNEVNYFESMAFPPSGFIDYLLQLLTRLAGYGYCRVGIRSEVQRQLTTRRNHARRALATCTHGPSRELVSKLTTTTTTTTSASCLLRSSPFPVLSCPSSSARGGAHNKASLESGGDEASGEAKYTMRSSTTSCPLPSSSPLPCSLSSRVCIHRSGCDDSMSHKFGSVFQWLDFRAPGELKLGPKFITTSTKGTWDAALLTSESSLEFASIACCCRPYFDGGLPAVGGPGTSCRDSPSHNIPNGCQINQHSRWPKAGGPGTSGIGCQIADNPGGCCTDNATETITPPTKAPSISCSTSSCTCCCCRHASCYRGSPHLEMR